MKIINRSVIIVYISLNVIFCQLLIILCIIKSDFVFLICFNIHRFQIHINDCLDHMLLEKELDKTSTNSVIKWMILLFCCLCFKCFSLLSLIFRAVLLHACRCSNINILFRKLNEWFSAKRVKCRYDIFKKEEQHDCRKECRSRL